MAHSLKDLKFFRKAVESLNLSCDDIGELALDGFSGLYLLSTRTGCGRSAWLSLNTSLNPLGYCAVFLQAQASLTALANNLEWVAEFYEQDFDDFDQDEPGLETSTVNGAPRRASSLFSNGKAVCLQEAVGSGSHPADQSVPNGGEAQSQHGRFMELLEELAQQSRGPGEVAAAFNPQSDYTVDFTETLRFLAGESLSFSPEAMERAAEKLEELENIELTPRLSKLRQSRRIPSMHDYEQAAQELDLERWLLMRQDQVLESRPQTAVGDAVDKYSPALAWSQQDWPQIKSADELIGQCSQLLIVPVARTELVPAFFHFGGYSGTPPAHVHLAAINRWKSRYAPRLLAIDHDALSFFVEKPAGSDDAALLALEHFRYCPDKVTRAAGSIEYLARALVGSDIWQFTWG